MTTVFCFNLKAHFIRKCVCLQFYKDNERWSAALTLDVAIERKKIDFLFCFFVLIHSKESKTLGETFESTLWTGN